jgi:lipopolysaccharide export system protein LptA
MHHPNLELSRAFLPAIALVMSLTAADAHALSTDRSKPVDIRSDRSETVLGEGVATLEGSVEIIQGSLRINADKAIVHQDPKSNAIVRVELEGGPATLQQDLDTGGQTRVRARRIDYMIQDENVLMRGDVMVQQPRGELRGENVRYDLKTGKLVGGEQGGRVQMRIEPAKGTD